MILFFSQLFAQALRSKDDTILFGETTKAYKNLNLKAIQMTHHNYKSSNSISQKASVDYEELDVQKGSMIMAQINPSLLNNPPSQILDANGNKKRVTIFSQKETQNSSPTHRPKIESPPVKRKSILLNGTGVSTTFGLNETQGIQSQAPSEFQAAMQNGNNNMNKQNFNFDQDNTPTKLVLNKVNCDNIVNENENSERLKSSSKPPIQQQKQPILPPGLKQQIETYPYKINDQNQYEQNEQFGQQRMVQNEQLQNNGMKRNLLSSQPSKYNENELSQPKLLVNDKVEEYDGLSGLQQKNRAENYSPDQSPPSSNRRSASPNNQPNSSRVNYQQVKGINNVADMKRSSTQSTLNIMMNAQTNQTNSFYNTNNPNNLLSMSSSPSINPQSNSLIHQNSFNLQNQNINDLSRNQFDDTMQSNYKQNHFNNSQIRHPQSLNHNGNSFTSYRQSDQFYEDDQNGRIRELSGNSNIQSDFQKKMNNNSSRLSKSMQQSAMMPISKINNIYGDKTYKAKALKVQNPIKGDLQLQEGSIYEVKISKNSNQEYVQIVSNNKSGIFKKELFKFFENPELNSYQFSMNQNYPSQNMSYDYGQQRQTDSIPLSKSIISNDMQNISGYQQMPLSNITPLSMYQRQFERNNKQNNQTQYY